MEKFSHPGYGVFGEDNFTYHDKKHREKGNHYSGTESYPQEFIQLFSPPYI